MLSLTHLSPCILKVVNIAFIDKASIQFCSIINLFFPFDFGHILSLVLSPSFERILSFTAAETADSVDWEMLGLAS